MAFDEELAGRIRDILADQDGIVEKKMFGGLAFMLWGNMACGVTKDDELMVRVGPDAYDEALTRPHAREMDFTGRPMRGMVFVGTEGFTEDNDLADWVGQGVAFASSLPRK